MNTYATLPLSLLLAFTAVSSATSQEVAVREAKTQVEARPWSFSTTDIPVDSRIHFSTLKNGMRVAWAKNAEPRDRSYVRLHVDVGSLAETDDEAGMAHFLEHMAFNGTEHFAADQLIRWFQEHGMAFGADTNAMTAFSETIYMLDLPNSDASSITSALGVLRDFAGGMLLSSEEIEAEKGVIDGEERERDSANLRMAFGSLEKLYAGTRLPTRFPIGHKSARDAFSSESVRRFYETWYRPENMTVLIVGDLGELDPMPLIESAFADFTPPEIPLQAEPDIGEVPATDKAIALFEAEASITRLSLQQVYPRDKSPLTQAKWRADVPVTAAQAMLNLRFAELAKQPDSPFLMARCGSANDGLDILDGVQLTIICKPDRWKDALSAADLELRRALQFGFQEAELKEVQADLLLDLDDSAARDAKIDSRAIIAKLLASCESAQVPYDAVTRRDILRPVAEALTVKECHDAFAAEWARGNSVISSVGNLDLGDDAAATLTTALAESRKIAPEQGEEIESTPFAYAADAKSEVKPTGQQHVEDLDFTTVEFANGVRLNVKATDFDDREVQLLAAVGEGLLTLPDDRLTVGAVADSAFLAGGLEAHSRDDIRRLTAGKQAGLGFSVANDNFVFSSNTTREDLQFVCELICAYLNHAGWRDTGLVQVHRQFPIIMENLRHQLQGPLMTEFTPALYNGNPRFSAIPELDDILNVSMDDVEGWLASELATSPIELTVVGAIDVDEVVAQVGRTFGVLAERRAWNDHDDRRVAKPAKGGLRMRSTVETESDTALVSVVFPTSDGIDSDRRRNLFLLGLVIDDRIREQIRERLGASYSPSAGSNSSRVFPGVGTIAINANCDPNQVDPVTEACIEVATKLAKDGVGAEELHRLTEPVLARIRDQQRDNGAWANYLSTAQRDPSSLDATRNHLAFFQAANPELVSKLAKEYLKPENASVLIVTPERNANKP